MSDKSAWATYGVMLFLFLTGAATMVLPHGYSLGFYGICFMGLALWPSIRNRLLVKGITQFALPVLAYAAGNLLLGLHEELAWRTIDPVLPFGLMVFGLWTLRRYKPRANWFWIGLAVGSMGAAGISGYQAIKLGLRAEGFTHAIQFGNIALLFGVLCMVRALTTFKLSCLNMLMWLGFASGVAASVWSQTRGGWLAIALVFVWVMMQVTKSWSKRLLVVFVLFGCIAILAMQIGFVKRVDLRLAEIVTETSAYFQTNQQNTAVGSRLAMWRFAVQQVSDAPLLGHGKQGWVELRDQAIAHGELDPFIANFSHVHNEYLDVLLKRGVVGLMLLLLLYLGPMFYFFKSYLKETNVDVKSLAIAGMVIPMMYMDFGLTQVFLSHNSGRMVLVSLWMCVAALLLNAVEDNRSHDAI